MKKVHQHILFYPLLNSLAFFLILALLVLLKQLSIFILIGYFCLSIITYIIYALDKSAAKKGQWRIPENTLHLLSLFGGWTGAMLAQQSLRHKSQKQPFRLIFWITVLINLSLLFLWIYI